ncbi:methyltransferase domain-containing protein [Actinoplanes sp. NPDC049316]|uniref:methyltransferase domain-containing protein n=1 Tax=Actinoplanes sp. NPDC049316 TaxID=3154727 RepID=UPI0034447BE8
MNLSDDTIGRVPADVYLHDARRGPTLHFSDPAAIHRDLAALDVPDGARVLEIGTGTGYSSALLAELVGPAGHIVSVDVDSHLVEAAARLHHERGIRTVTCHTADGLAGHPPGAPYDRIVAWLCPPRLPAAWVQQLAPGGRIVTCLPVAELPSANIITTITVHAGQPHAEQLAFGGYAQSHQAPIGDVHTIPPRWVDATTGQHEASWIAISWRASDPHRAGARAALRQLLHPGHTDTYGRAPLGWRSLTAFTAALADPHLTAVSLHGHGRGIGHTTLTSAAVILTDGSILADDPQSVSLRTLHTWLRRWERATRPGPDDYTTTLTAAEHNDLPGWELRLRIGPAHTRQAVRR